VDIYIEIEVFLNMSCRDVACNLPTNLINKRIKLNREKYYPPQSPPYPAKPNREGGVEQSETGWVICGFAIFIL